MQEVVGSIPIGSTLTDARVTATRAFFFGAFVQVLLARLMAHC